MVPWNFEIKWERFPGEQWIGRAALLSAIDGVPARR
jgi:hypothetical protein